jgi:DNA repair protein RecN (Recombination protein N)
MLLGLAIGNVVLIERLDLAFGTGLLALTGETGAGKSILLDALGLVIGGRGDAGLVRHGAESAVVSAEFALPPRHPARTLLAEQDLEAGDVLVLRRSLSADGRSRAFADDQPISVGLLRRIGATLVEIHGQFETQGLLDQRIHRDLLDRHGGLGPFVQAVASAWADWRQHAEARDRARGDADTARREEEMLRHAAEELGALAPRPGEESALADRRTALQHREKVAEATAAALDELAGDRGAERALAGARRALQRMADRAAGRFDPVLDMIDRALDGTLEAAAALERLTLEDDGGELTLERVEDRLYALRAAARKYGVSSDDLPGLLAETEAKLELLADHGARVRVLERAAEEARIAYTAAADALSQARIEAAATLDRAVTGELGPLKLDRAQFRTELERLPESEWGPGGADRATFLIAANPGSPPGPIGRVASGGELARIMLAMKVVLTQNPPGGTMPVLVFDEVDSGIGGATAEAVGLRLHRLARQGQVLVVTHSPQVAAVADRQWRVRKADRNGRATTTVDPLAPEERREEVARMLSGAVVSDEARAAARRLIEGRLL